MKLPNIHSCLSAWVHNVLCMGVYLHVTGRINKQTKTELTGNFFYYIHVFDCPFDFFFFAKIFMNIFIIIPFLY